MKKDNKKKLVLKKNVKLFITRVMLVLVIYISSLILIKSDDFYKDIIRTNVYEDSFDFYVFRNYYDKYLSNVDILDKLIVEERVFSEDLLYSSNNTFLNGVSLDVTTDYMVPSIESGIVIFIGDIEGYGSSVIIEGIDGVDISYSNIEVSGINLYDYINKGDVVGITKDKELRLIFQKDGEYLDYKNFV